MMEETRLRCPRCGSMEISETASGKLECTKCGTHFQILLSEENKISTCPICGNEDPAREMFTCSRCGDKNICKSHSRDGICSTCYYDMRLKAERASKYRWHYGYYQILGNVVPEHLIPWFNLLSVFFLLVITIVAMVLTTC